MVSRVCRGLLTLSLRPRVVALRPWLQVPAMSAKAVSTSADGRAKFRLTLETVNARVKDMQYAVRGQLPIEAMKIEDAIANGETSYPFDRVLYCNIGDCHAMGQQPLTFVRQLVSACLYPPSSSMYPQDVQERAKTILDSIKGGSLGGYSDSRGIAVIRQHAAQFIGERDGIPCDWRNIYLVNGASDGIKAMLFMFMSDDQKAGVMIPIPQYPLYTASIAELAAHPIGYHLDEAHNWAINVEDLRKNIRKARDQCQPRVLVVINPGNPTGQYLPLENMKEIIKFCHDEGLVLFTDEVYQENVYAEGAKFHSFRKVVKSMGSEYDGFQMASFNSTSKGFFGECGMRGGYMELMNFDEDVMDQIYKFCSAKLCSNTTGQVVTDALVKRPQPGDPSFELYDKEKKVVLLALKNKAKMVYDKMNKIPGVQCNEVQGAMYAFPKIDIPEKALKDAQAEDPNMTLDTYYCLEFLRQKGVCVVPGSGFGQKPGTWHFRTTILPSEKDLEDMLDKFADFHIGFLRKYEK